MFQEAVKPVLYNSFAPVIDWNEEDTATLPVSRTMLLCLETYLRLLAPFMPFLSEELYFILTGKKVHNAPFPTQDQYVQFRNSNLDADFRYIMNIVKGNKLRFLSLSDILLIPANFRGEKKQVICNKI